MAAQMKSESPADASLQHEKSNVIEMPRRCEGKRHPEGSGGHGGNAAWVVTAICPVCAWADVVLLCDGRVQAIVARDGDFSCGTCASSFHWSEAWTLSPLGGAA